MASQTEAAVPERQAVESVRRLARSAVSKHSRTRPTPDKAKAAATGMVVEHLYDQWQNLGPSAVDDIEAEVELKRAEVWSFITEELWAGHAKVIRDARGKLHIKSDREI